MNNKSTKCKLLKTKKEILPDMFLSSQVSSPGIHEDLEYFPKGWGGVGEDIQTMLQYILQVITTQVQQDNKDIIEYSMFVYVYKYNQITTLTRIQYISAKSPSNHFEKFRGSLYFGKILGVGREIRILTPTPWICSMKLANPLLMVIYF